MTCFGGFIKLEKFSDFILQVFVHKMFSPYIRTRFNPFTAYQRSRTLVSCTKRKLAGVDPHEHHRVFGDKPMSKPLAFALVFGVAGCGVALPIKLAHLHCKKHGFI